MKINTIICLALTCITQHVATRSISKINDRITGGEEVKPHSLPYQVGLFIFTFQNTFFCGGALISSKTVLTAGHCVQQAIVIELVLGAHRVQENEDSQIRQRSNIGVMHPDFEGTWLVNDIAVIFLPNEIEFNTFIQRIPLPVSQDQDYTNDIGVISGWGIETDVSASLSAVLRKAEVEIISNEKCFESYDLMLRDTNICTSGQGGKAPCSGDGGGPLAASSGEIVGISSFGSTTHGCESGFPSGFTRVTSYLDWIKENMM